MQNKPCAIIDYLRSLDVDPDNANVIGSLKKLELLR